MDWSTEEAYELYAADEEMRARIEAGGYQTTNGDEIFARIVADQGFDGPPAVAPAPALDAAVEAGGIEIWRGVKTNASMTAADMAEQFRTGALYPGVGVHGSGTYTSIHRETAELFAGRDRDRIDDGRLMRMVLKPDARILDEKDPEFDEITREWAAQDRADIGRYAGAGPRSVFRDDPGRAAAVAGYDAIRVSRDEWGESDTYYVVLNRTALLVQDEDVDTPDAEFEAPSGQPVREDPPEALAAAAERRAAIEAERDRVLAMTPEERAAEVERQKAEVQARIAANMARMQAEEEAAAARRAAGSAPAAEDEDPDGWDW